MSPDKEKQLFEKYPKIFSNLKYTECGDGWYDLIERLCTILQSEADNAGYSLSEEEKEAIQPLAAQVKEKFGGLRFYIYGGNERMWGAISMAEAMSFKICEDCGVPGHRQPGGWIRTLCDPCQEKRLTRDLNTDQILNKIRST